MDDMEDRLGATEGTQKRAPGRGPRSPVQVDERLLAERGRSDRDTTEDRELSEGDRLELFRESLVQSVLPDLPKVPGYHVCWLTTTNPRDSIQWRVRIGYELMRVEQCPGWDGVTLNTGDYAGVIGVNEMVAARIPLSLYNRYMREVHHSLPMQEEEKLRAQTQSLKEAAEARGSYVQEGDGTANVIQRADPMPEMRN